MAIFYADVAVTTLTGGGFTGYTGPMNGPIHKIQYIKTDFANNVTLVVTTETTAQAVLTIAAAAMDVAKEWCPRTVANKVADGVAHTDYDIPIYAVRERIKVVIAAGGDGKLGTIRVYFEG